MSEEVNGALKKVAKGTTAVFGGTAAGMVLALLWRLIAIRTMAPYDFGVFFLAVSVINLLTAISSLGLPDGVPRYIAYFRGKNDDEKVGAIVRGGIIITTLFSLFIVIIIFILAPWLAEYMALPGLDSALWIMILSMPLFSIAVILTSVFRAYGIVRVKVYFIEAGKRVFILGGILVLMFAGSVSLESVSIAFSLSGVAVFILVLAYYRSHRPDFKRVTNRETLKKTEKELLIFSLPLLGMGFMDTMFMAAQPTMLGFLGTADDIAVFGAGRTVAVLVGVAMTSLNFLYLPIMSDFFARNMKAEMRKVYALVSKWAFFSMSLMIMGFILLSDVMAPLLFGNYYQNAGLIMTVQAIGFFSIYLFGPVRATLIVVGRPYFLVVSAGTGLVVSIILSVVLIQQYAALGASVSMAAGLFVMYILNASNLQKTEGLNPFSKKYTKTFAGGLVFMALAAFLKFGFRLSSYVYVLLFLLLSAAYIGYIFFAGAIEDEDREMVRIVRGKVGLI